MSLMYLSYGVSGNACVLISFHRFASIVCPQRRVLVRRHSTVRLTFLLCQLEPFLIFADYLRLS